MTEAIAQELGPVATKVIFENDDVKVWEMDLAPGELCGLHRHTMDYVLYILEGAKLEVESPGHESFALDFGSRGTYFVPPGAVESARNVGDTRFYEVLVEIKRTARRKSSYAASEALAGREPESGAITILDNDRMRVSELTLAPGTASKEQALAHDAVMYVAEGSRLRTDGAHPDTQSDGRECDYPAGTVRWLARGTRQSFVNVGPGRYRQMMLEIK